MIDLDHNATTRPLPAVVAAMVQAMEGAWANPSSMHQAGQTARRALADARARVAAFLGCQGAELVFTSGATEANHQAVLGALARGRALGRTRLVVSAVEHAGLLALTERLEREGTPVDRIPVDGQGRLDLDAAARLIGPDVALLSVMAANNETGVWHPLAELSALARAHEVPFHVDATQAVGKSTLRFDASGADLWSCSAHKMHGPQGVGALLARKGLAWPALIEGKQERKRRGGTENGPGIAGFAAAADALATTLAEDVARMTDLRQTLEQGLLALHPAIVLLGQGAERIANTVCVRFGERDAEQVLGKLERAGVLASSGAACGAGSTQPSQVMLAMGLTPLQAKAEVRFSLGRDTTAQDIDAALAAVRSSVLPLLLEDHPNPVAWATAA